MREEEEGNVFGQRIANGKKNPNYSWLNDIVVKPSEEQYDQNNIVILATFEDPKLTSNNAISSKGPNDIISMTLEATHKKQDNIVSAKLNDVVSSEMGSLQTARIWARPPTHFTEAHGLIKNWTQAQITIPQADPLFANSSRAACQSLSRAMSGEKERIIDHRLSSPRPCWNQLTQFSRSVLARFSILGHSGSFQE